jgi:predicted outer membrane repeat protein
MQTPVESAHYSDHKVSSRQLGRKLLWLLFSVAVGAAFALGVLLFFAPEVQAASYTVTNTNDSGAGSLRAAIQSANASAGLDVINFNLAGCPCSIKLASSLVVTGPLSIVGPGAATLSLDGQGTVRVLNISNVPVSISGMTILGGNAGAGNGGGIFSGGALTLTQVSLAGNAALSGGGAYVTARLQADNLTVDSNQATNGSGGGIYAASNVLMTNSVIQNNTVITNGYGGGLLVVGVFTATDTNFVGNAVTNGYDGGGLYASGGLKLTGGQFTRNRVTRQKGYGGGGGVISFGRISITGTQFISNTAADWGGGAYLADFVAGHSSSLTNVSFVSNTASGGGGGGLFMWFTSTLTSPTFINNKSGYRGGGAYAGYAGSYRTIINGGYFSHNTASGGGGFYSDGSFALDGTQIVSNTSRSGNGGGAWTPANASVANAYIAYNTVITAGNSGGLDTGGSVIITNTTFVQNRTLTGNGGGSGAGGNATLTDVHYEGNSAKGVGGGVLSLATARVTRGTFTANKALNNWGGGLFALSSFVVTNTDFISNSSAFAAGALAAQNSTGRISGGRFERNTAFVGGWGGGVYVGGPSLYVSGTLFISNTALGPGGAVASNNITSTNATYQGNSATDRGGGIYAGGLVTADNNLFSNNRSQADGGGIALGGKISLTRSQLIGNQANQGGGLSQFSGSGQVVNSLFAGNTALASSGEALSLAPNGTTQVLQTTIASPTLAGGSAVFVNGGTVSLIDTIIASHTLGIVQASGAVNADYNLFFGNTINTQGGGITNNHPRSGNPVFFAPWSDDYHLGAGSAAVNTGTNAGVTIDFDGEARPQGSGFDIGYDESSPPEGLSAANDGPTLVGNLTTFTASVTFGRAVSYQWDFGDGSFGSGSTAAHVYATPGQYVATVTAANGAGSLTAQTTVQVMANTIYLPFIRR